VPENEKVVVLEADRLKVIEESYSGDTIADTSTIRQPFKFGGGMYVSVGAVYRGPITIQHQCYKIVPRSQFAGATGWYGDRSAETPDDDWATKRRAQPEGFYHGMLVKRGKTEWVLAGPPILVVLEAGTVQSKQACLF